MGETIEIKYEFKVGGSADLDKAAGSAKKVEDGSRKAGVAMDLLAEMFKKAGESGRQFDGLGDKIRAGVTSPLQLAGDASTGFLESFRRGLSLVNHFADATARIKNFAEEAIKGAVEVRGLSLSTGLATGKADQLRAAAVLAGFDIRNLKEAALDLSVALKGVGSEGQQTRDLLRQLGVSLNTTSGEARPLPAVLEDTFEALSKIKDVTTRVNLSRVLGGEDAAKSVQPLLAQYAKLNSEARSLGFGTRDGVVQSLIDAQREITKMDLQFEVLKGNLSRGIVIPLRFVNESIQTLTKEGFTPLLGPRPGGGTQSLERIGPEFLERFLPKPVDPVGQSLAARFRAGLSNSETGMRTRLDAIAKERIGLQQKLSDPDLSASTHIKLEGDLKRIEAEQDNLEKRIKDLDRARQRREQDIARLEGFEKSAGVAGLGTFGRLLGDRDSLRSSLGAGATDRINAAFNPLLTAEMEKLLHSARRTGAQSLISFANEFERDSERSGELAIRGFYDKLKKAIEADGDAFKNAHQSLAVFAQLDRERLIIDANAAIKSDQLRSGPTDAIGSAEREFRIRKNLAEELFKIAQRQAEFEQTAGEKKLALLRAEAERSKSLSDAEADRAVRILEIRRQALDRAKDTAGRVFDSINSRDGGFQIGDLLKGQRDILLRQVFVNATGGIFQGLSGIGGNIGRSLGPFGKLFEGTFLDPNNADSATDKNTTATERNTAALEKLTAGGSGGFIPGVGRLSDFISDGNGITGQGGGFSGIGGLLNRIPGLNKTNGATSFLDSLFGTSGGKGVGAAAGVGLGSLSLIQGIKGGDAGGIATGILGLASAIPGPQQPFVVAGALMAGFVSNLFGNNRQKFDRDQNDLLNSRRFADPTSGSRSTDLLSGDDISTDFDFRGRTRIVFNRNITVKIDAIDARSIEERGFDISQAVAKQVDAGMPISESINRAVFGAGVA